MANKRNRIEVTDDYSSVHVRRMSNENYAPFKGEAISIAFIINEEIELCSQNVIKIWIFFSI